MHKKINVIVAILLVGLVSAGFFYFHQNKKIAKDQKNVSTQNSLPKTSAENKIEQLKSNLPRTTEYTTADGVIFSYSDFLNLKKDESEKDSSIYFFI